MDQSEIPEAFEMGGNMKVYVMPNGKKYRYKDNEVPPGAVLFKKEEPIEEKAKEVPNKAKRPVNKAKKAATK